MSMFHELMMKKKGIPSRYQEVEYIESTGTQYIDTGYTPVEYDNIEVEFRVNSLKSTQALFSAGTDNYQLIAILDQYTTYVKYFRTGLANSITLPATNEFFALSMNSNGVTSLGTSTILNAYQSALDGSNTTLYLFCRRNKTSFFYGAMKSFRVTNNGVVKKNYIPVYDTETQKYGMWETVQGKFYGNDGTGDFKGSIVGYTVVGSPTITDGVVSGFSSANYLQCLPNLPNYTKLERFVKFNTGTSTTNTRTIIGSSPYGSINLEATTNKIRTTIFVSPTYATMTLNTALLENTTYYYRDILENGTVKGYLYDSNMNLIEEKSSALGYDTGRYFIIGKTTNSERPFTNGSVYLNETYVKVDNKLWFNGQQA